MKKSVLEIKDLFFKYPKSKEFLLKGIDLTIFDGENIGIIGSNGCGKSTLAKLTLGIQQPHSGQIRLYDQNSAWKIHYPQIGYIGDPGYTTEELGLPGRLLVKTVIKVITKLHPESNPFRQQQIINNLEINELLPKFIDELSTGQRKRLMACLSLLRDPDFLILDEPFDGLDKHIKKYLINTLLSYCKDQQKTILLISHDKIEIDTLCDKVFEISDGKLVASKQQYFDVWIKSGNSEEVLRKKSGEVLGLLFDKMEECVTNSTSLDISLSPQKDDGEYKENSFDNRELPERYS